MNKRKVETLKGFLPEQEGILTRCFGLVVEGVPGSGQARPYLSGRQKMSGPFFQTKQVSDSRPKSGSGGFQA